MDYFEIMGVGMFIDRADPKSLATACICLAGREGPTARTRECTPVEDHEILPGGHRVVSLCKLVEMKLTAFRDQIASTCATWSMWGCWMTLSRSNCRRSSPSD